MADDSRGAVDREIDPWGHGASRDHGHDTDERFQHHGTIADKARLPLPKNHFRRGARGDQRVKSADGAARNSDEAEWEYFPGKHRPGPIDEASEGRHQYLWAHQQDARGKRENGARLDERDQ